MGPSGTRKWLEVGGGVWAVGAVLSCVPPLPEPGTKGTVDLAVGEKRVVELRAIRFEVQGAQQALDLDQLRSIPESVLDDVWLLDMDLRPLVSTVIETFRSDSFVPDGELTPATANMRRLLRTTPDNVDMTGTSLESLIGLAATVGLPPGRVLAEIFEIGTTDPLVTTGAVTTAMLEGVIASHPNAQYRAGPVTDAHPDGQYAVQSGSIPISLADVSNNFANLTARFGSAPIPDDPEQRVHPGFLHRAEHIQVVNEDMALRVKISGNVLPFRGIDLSSATEATVSSLPSQMATLFAVSDPDWLIIDGLVPDLRVGDLVFRLVENAGQVASGNSREPFPTGNSPVWELPPWQIEPLVANMTRLDAAAVSDHCSSYRLGTGALAFEACVDGTHWTEIETFNGLGEPPPPSYLWDLELNLAQVRLHDNGVPEGAAVVELRLRNAPIGISPQILVEQIRQNIAEYPQSLEQVVRLVFDNVVGDADFFYFRPRGAEPDGVGADYLFFVTPRDIALGPDGSPRRPYAYRDPGFFSDPALAHKVSTTVDLDGDTEHEKVPVGVGDTVYLADDADRLFGVSVLSKPSPGVLQLEIERLR